MMVLKYEVMAVWSVHVPSNPVVKSQDNFYLPLVNHYCTPDKLE